LHAAASQVVRKEIAALSKVATRCAADGAAWQAAVDEFYVEHARYVGDKLQIGTREVAVYVQEQRASLLCHGASCMVDWECQRVRDLMVLAAGGEQIVEEVA